MTGLAAQFGRVREDATAARVYFHTWWALRSLAYPDYLPVMNDHAYVDFFHAAHTGFLKLTFISLSKLFDREALGLGEPRRLLEAEGHVDAAALIRAATVPKTELVKKLLRIRNKSVAHTEKEIHRHAIYETNPVTPDEIRDLIDGICTALDDVGGVLGSGTRISDGQRQERAVMELLKRLDDCSTQQATSHGKARRVSHEP